MLCFYLICFQTVFNSFFFQFPFGCFFRQIRSIIAACCAEYGHPTTPSNASMKRMKITLRLKTYLSSPSDRNLVRQHFHALFCFIFDSSNFELNPIAFEYDPEPPNGNRFFYHISYFSLTNQTNTQGDHALIGVRNTHNQRELFIYF